MNRDEKQKRRERILKLTDNIKNISLDKPKIAVIQLSDVLAKLILEVAYDDD